MPFQRLLGAHVKSAWLTAALQVTVTADVFYQLDWIPTNVAIAVSMLLPVVWLILLLRALVKFGWRGCWLLLPAPFCIGILLPLMLAPFFGVYFVLEPKPSG